MLLELAVGDAYGAGFEYVNRNIIEQHNTLARYIKHPRHNIIPGYYTDDTQMSLAIAEAIVAEEDWTPINLANRFVDCFKRDPREGYAGRFHAFLTDIRDGAEFLEKIIPTSDKSGAAMRAVPIGIYPTIDGVLEKARIQAKITHDTPDGIHAAQAAALLAHYFIYALGDKVDVGAFINEHAVGDWDETYSGKVKAKGWMSVQAAITAVQRNDSLSSLLIDCVNFTGDVDTVATIALGAVANSEQYTQDLPEHLILSLENGIYGREYITKLDAQLMALKA